MKLKNNFPDYAWTTFMDGWKCWYCGMNTADCLHHIVGRGGPLYECENSILNAAPMCNLKCHIPNHGKITTDDYKKIYLQITFDYLSNHQYEFTDKDREFAKKYERYYRRDQLSLIRKSKHKQDLQWNALGGEEQDKERISPVHAPVQRKTKIRRK